MGVAEKSCSVGLTLLKKKLSKKCHISLEFYVCYIAHAVSSIQLLFTAPHPTRNGALNSSQLSYCK